MAAWAPEETPQNLEEVSKAMQDAPQALKALSKVVEEASQIPQETSHVPEEAHLALNESSHAPFDSDFPSDLQKALAIAFPSGIPAVELAAFDEVVEGYLKVRFCPAITVVIFLGIELMELLENYS